MIDPLTLFMVGAGVLAFREMNRKDYGVLTAARDERYRNAMENCHVPQTLLEEAKLFAEHGLKAQAAMLKRRAEWRSRSEQVRQQHEAIYQKAMGSTNIQAILEVAAAFEGWTATKKASALREKAQVLHEEALQKVNEPVVKGETACKTLKGVENVADGWACCVCSTYNGEQRTICKHCGHTRCGVSEQPEIVEKIEEGEEKKTNGIAKTDIPQNNPEEQKSTETP